MLVRAARWFLIGAPVLAGILVLIFGTAGSISITFGIVLIGIGPIIWLWNWLVRMSFEEDDRAGAPAERERQDPGPHRQEQPPGHARHRHSRRRATRLPRRRS
jgi:hypothetical protein